jgi:hypothetical protein
MKSVGVGEVHGVVVFVVFGRRIDDFCAHFSQKLLKSVHIFSTLELESIVTEAEFSFVVLMLFIFSVYGGNPEASFSVRPTHGVVVLIENFETHELKETAVKTFGLFIITYRNRKMVDAFYFNHKTSSCPEKRFLFDFSLIPLQTNAQSDEEGPENQRVTCDQCEEGNRSDCRENENRNGERNRENAR